MNPELRGADLLDMLRYGRVQGLHRELDGVLWNAPDETSRDYIVVMDPIAPVAHRWSPRHLSLTLRAFNKGVGR